jgi:diketogulonate reductase-like aldo/keto reductase
MSNLLSVLGCLCVFVHFSLSLFASRLLKHSPRSRTLHPQQIALPGSCRFPGTTKRERLDENLGAPDIHLTAEDLREIDRAASQIEVPGARYPEPLLKMVGR